MRGGPETAEREAVRLRKALERSVELDGLVMHTQGSVGIACAPQHGTRSGDLLRHADVAMYRAKQRRTGVDLYAAEGDRNSRQRLADGQMRNVARTDLDPDSVQVVGTEFEPEALVCCPMRSDAGRLGVLNVYRTGASAPFSADEAATVERFAAVAALALRRGAVATGPDPIVR